VRARSSLCTPRSSVPACSFGSSTSGDITGGDGRRRMVAEAPRAKEALPQSLKHRTRLRSSMRSWRRRFSLEWLRDSASSSASRSSTMSMSVFKLSLMHTKERTTTQKNKMASPA